jgi:hypothetical protein
VNQRPVSVNVKASANALDGRSLVYAEEHVSLSQNELQTGLDQWGKVNQNELVEAYNATAIKG